MKVSVLSQVLSGASAVSAAACPHVVHVPFTQKFEVVTLEEAQAKAANDPGFIEYQASLGIHVGDAINVNVTIGLPSIGKYPTAPPPAPETEEPEEPEEPSGTYPVAGEGSYPVKPLKQRQFTKACTNPAVRVEWRNMKEADKKSFVDAVKCL